MMSSQRGVDPRSKRKLHCRVRNLSFRTKHFSKDLQVCIDTRDPVLKPIREAQDCLSCLCPMILRDGAYRESDRASKPQQSFPAINTVMSTAIKPFTSIYVDAVEGSGLEEPGSPPQAAKRVRQKQKPRPAKASRHVSFGAEVLSSPSSQKQAATDNAGFLSSVSPEALPVTKAGRSRESKSSSSSGAELLPLHRRLQLRSQPAEATPKPPSAEEQVCQLSDYLVAYSTNLCRTLAFCTALPSLQAIAVPRKPHAAQEDANSDVSYQEDDVDLVKRQTCFMMLPPSLPNNNSKDSDCVSQQWGSVLSPAKLEATTKKLLHAALDSAKKPVVSSPSAAQAEETDTDRKGDGLGRQGERQKRARYELLHLHQLPSSDPMPSNQDPQRLWVAWMYALVLQIRSIVSICQHVVCSQVWYEESAP